MNIQITENKNETLQVIIKCRQIDDEIMRLKCHIELFDQKLQAKKDNELYFINLSEVLYFESVDNRTFLYTENDVMEVKQRLYEKDIIHFLTWMRNGIAYATTWFLILILLYNKLHNHQAISTDSLIKMVLWLMGSVFMFNLLFTHIIIKRWNFLLRLSVFMILISLYELLGFYWLGVFPNNISPINWFF